MLVRKNTQSPNRTTVVALCTIYLVHRDRNSRTNANREKTDRYSIKLLILINMYVTGTGTCNYSIYAVNSLFSCIQTH